MTESVAPIRNPIQCTVFCTNKSKAPWLAYVPFKLSVLLYRYLILLLSKTDFNSIKSIFLVRCLLSLCYARE